MAKARHYPGGKGGAGTYPKIINLMPPHQLYVEPFLGNGAILRRKRPAIANIGIDADPAVIAKWAAAQPGGLGQTGEVSGQLGGPGEVSSWRFETGDGISFLQWYPLGENDLVYCDPPYVRSTRRCSSRDIYAVEMDDRQHARLLEIITGLHCQVMISGYYSALYADALKGWNSVNFQAMTRRGLATEWLWFNFAEPAALHDYRYVGAGFRQRENIKRQKRRWVDRLKAMPVLERRSLLDAIDEAWSTSGANGE